MDLRHLSDQVLLTNTDRLAQTERETMTALLHHLREIERRRLFADLKYSSLQDYAMKRLKFLEDQAGRRIQAMRLLKDLPPQQAAMVEEKISSGALNMTNLGLAQTLFNHEKRAGRQMDCEEKLEVLEKFEGCSTREAKKVAREVSPDFIKVKTLDFDQIEDEVLREKLLRVRGKYAHSHPNISLTELLHLMCDHELAPAKSAAPRDASRRQPKTGAQISREVWARDEAQCTNCGSTYAVQEDHRNPKANGGGYTTENIRLLCRSCNQRAAIVFYGQAKMNRFLKSPVRPYSAVWPA